MGFPVAGCAAAGRLQPGCSRGYGHANRNAHAFPDFRFHPAHARAQVAAGATEVAATLAADSGFVLNADKVGYGQGRWDFLECGSCHGADGSGTDNGPSLLAYSASESAFIDTIRTGGAAGSMHRFPAERLSNSGVSNLYHYVRSLGSAG